jgi:hypothetical protein
MHTYIYIHTPTHTYIHTHIHTYIHPYIHAYIHAYIHRYIHTPIHTYVLLRTYYVLLHTATCYVLLHTFVFEPQVQSSTSSPLPTTCPRPTINADPTLGLLQRQGAVQIHEPDERLECKWYARLMVRVSDVGWPQVR